MTYRCGIAPGIPGLTPGPSHIFCDGCGEVYLIVPGRGGAAPSWFLDEKAPPGWRVVHLYEGTARQDWCPKCARVQPRCCDSCANKSCGDVGQAMTTLCGRFVRDIAAQGT